MTNNVIKKVYKNWTEYQIYASWWAAGAGDVSWPISATDWHLAVFDGTTWKLIKDWWAVPTVNNATLTIQKNSTNVATFTANASSNVTANISVPTDTNDLTNWAGFITGISSSDVTTALWYTPVNPSSLGTAASKNTGTSSWNVPVLDSNWKLSTTILPWMALTDTFTVTNKSDLTSLSSAEQWDIGIVTSESKTYILSQAPYSTASNWKELLSPTDAVTSVNGKTWAVTLNADDISDSTTTNKFVTASDKTTWSGKQDALTLPSSITSWHLVTWWANNKTFADWWAVPSTSDCVKTSWNQTIAWTKTFSTSPVVPSKSTAAWNNATTIATEAQVYLKQDALATQTAYTSKWTSNKVPTINTNTWGQVTAISESNIAFPVTSVNSSTWDVTVNAVPSGWTQWQVLTKGSSWYDWATPASWITNDTTETTSTVTWIWAWSEAEYTDLSTKSWTVLYFTF